MVNKYAPTPNCTTGYTTKQDNEIVCMYRCPQEPEFRKNGSTLSQEKNGCHRSILYYAKSIFSPVILKMYELNID